MLNILLPAYSRQYTALHGVGLVRLADEMENQELEHVVLRERGVVWADQEGTGQQVKTEDIGGDSLETCGARNIKLHSELAPVLSFSHLQYHQSSPCSKSPFFSLFFCLYLLFSYMHIYLHSYTNIKLKYLFDAEYGNI